MPIGDIFNLLFFGPIVNLLVLIFRGLEFLHVPGATGFSVIILTVLIRLLVWPFMSTQLKSAKKMAELKPHLDLLKQKHKDDKQSFAKAQADLYKQNGVNPAAGCLPSLIQLPIVIALYQSILAFFNGQAGVDRVNNLLYVSSWRLNQAPDLNFFGLNLASKPSQFSQLGWAILLIPLVTAGLQFLQARMMAIQPVKQYPSDSPKEKKEKGETEDTAAAVQSQMMFMMPLMIGYFAFQFPAGLALYWNTFTLLGMVQQYFISGWGGLETWFDRVKKITTR